MARDVFREIVDEERFQNLVRTHHSGFVSELGIFKASVEIDDERLRVAFTIYNSGVERFAHLLDSSEPDHFKRAGALLDALNQSEVITKFEWAPCTDDKLCGMFLGYSYGDVEHDLPLIDFYDRYHNQAAAFDLAFRSCDSYEGEKHEYDQELAVTACNFLTSSPPSSEALFMFFKGLFFDTRKQLAIAANNPSIVG